MSFSYAEKNTPFVLSPRSLDEHLARGWYRMGSSIFTSHFLFFNQRPYSAIWIRLDLEDFSFSKRQRKLLKRNAQLFTVAAGPRVIDQEREALYAEYADDFSGHISPSIAENLEDFGEDCVFNTYETTVREQLTGELVAASYFDLGDDSAASILGIYQPRLKSFSLGYYTMLLEIDHCLRNGIRYYYPGYVVPGYERFDYKLRLGKSQYYSVQEGRWLPHSEEDVARFGPIESQLKNLAVIITGLGALDIERKALIYPLFEANLYDPWNDTHLPYPYLVYVGHARPGQPVVLCFDPKQMIFRLLHCAHVMQTEVLFNAKFLQQFSRDNFHTQLLTVQGILLETPSASLMVEAIARGLTTKP